MNATGHTGRKKGANTSRSKKTKRNEIEKIIVIMEAK